MTRPIALVTCLFGWLLVAATASAEVLPVVKPEEAGFSADRLARLARTLKSEIEQKRMPGAAVLVARRGRIGYFETFGKLDPAGNARCRRTRSSASTR